MLKDLRVKFRSEDAAVIRIQTEDYAIECWAKPLEARFPNYLRVIPDEEQNREWLSINARSAKSAFASIKGVIDSSEHFRYKSRVFINAEDPKHITLTAPGASVDIEGEASRPMSLQVDWELMSTMFFDLPRTKFMLFNVNKAVFAKEARAAQGATMQVTKVIMPIQQDAPADEWGIVDPAKIAPAEESEKADADEDDGGVSFGMRDESSEDMENEEACDKDCGEQGDDKKCMASEKSG
jgi:hypothetical protein